MKQTIIAWVLVVTMLFLASCGGTANPITPPPTVPTEIAMHVKAIEANQAAQAEYVKMLDAQRSATQAAANAQQIAGQVTAYAQQTRDTLAYTATRQAMNEQATRVAFNTQATQTRIAEVARASSAMQSVQITATQQAAQFTATAFAQSLGGTATAQSIIAQQTQVSASATATANAANAQATQVANSATATVTAEHVLTAQAKADWERRLESLRAVAWFAGVTLALIGALVIIGLGAIRFIDAGVLRARVLRDKTGTVFVIGERDKRGRQMVLVPGRSPGTALALTPPDETPMQIDAVAIDAGTTKRDQAVSLMIAASHGKRSTVDDVMYKLTAGGQIKIVDEPPAQLVGGEVKQILDGDWQRLDDGQ